MATENHNKELNKQKEEAKAEKDRLEAEMAKQAAEAEKVNLLKDAKLASQVELNSKLELAR